MNRGFCFLAILFILLGTNQNRNVNQGKTRRFSVYTLDERLYPILDSVITRIKHHPNYKGEYFGIRMSFIENVVDKRSEFALYPVLDSSLVTSPLYHNMTWFFIVKKDSSIMGYVYPDFGL